MEYKSKFKHLLEFNIKGTKDLSLKEIDGDNNTDSTGLELPDLGLDEPNQNNELPSLPPTNNETPPEMESNIDTNENPLSGDVDVLGSIAKVHAQKLDKVLDFINDLNDKMKNLDKTIETQTETISKQQEEIKKLKPPTPLENLYRMVDITGGKTIDQYWNSYSQDKGLDKSFTPDEEGFYSIDIKDINTKSSTSIKDSLFNNK
jgi:hypothetical protein